MLKIAALTDSFDMHSRNGGISSVLAMLHKQWAAVPKIKLDIWTLRGSTQNCMNIRQIPMAGIIGAVSFGRRGLAASYDVVFPQHAEMCIVPGSPRIVCFAHTVTSVEYNQKPKFWQSIVRFTERMGLQKADRILCLNKFIEGELVQRYKTAISKIRIVSNGVDTEWWSLGKEDTDRGGLVFVGRLIPRKQLSFAIRVVARLGEMGCFPRFTVVGDGPERESAMDLAKTLLKPGQFMFAGWVDQIALRQYLLSADCLLFPSKSEGLPLSILEAAAADTIPIYGRNGCEDLLQASPSIGVFIESWNIEDWANKIYEILMSSSTQNEIRNASRLAVNQRFCAAQAANAILRNLLEVYR